MFDPPLKGWNRLKDLVSSLCRPGLSVFGAEVGVSTGWTSEHLLQEYPRLRLLMVDLWRSFDPQGEYAMSGDSMAKLSDREQYAKMKHAFDRTLFAYDRRRIVRSDSVAAAGRVPDGWLDFAFIDGDHTHAGVLRDIEAWFYKVRAGGLMIGHDWKHPRDRRGLWGVTSAWTKFCESRGLSLCGSERDTICWCEVK